MDYKKLSDAIRLCGSTPKIHECKEKCPYYAGGDMMKCIPKLTRNAADAIIELNQENENNKRNLYYAIMQLRTIAWCNRCKHFRGIGGCELGDMNKCTEEKDLYEWDGLELMRMKKVIKPAVPEESQYICDLCGKEIEQDAYGTSVVEIVSHDV